MTSKKAVRNKKYEATGPAAPSPRRSFCSEPCYGRGKLASTIQCECEGCHGDAHGMGKPYAYENGYLKDSPTRSGSQLRGNLELFMQDSEEAVDELTGQVSS